MLTELRRKVSEETARTGKRRRITLTDTTLRDGHQCLWATRMRTEQMLPIAERLDNAGYGCIEAIALVQFDASVLFLNQDPLERIRLLAQRVRKTPLRGAVRSNMVGGFAPLADDISEFFVERMAANGIRDLVFLDALHCWDNIAPSVAAAKRLGLTITAPIIRFNREPGYNDDFYTTKVRDAITRFDPDFVNFGDAGGSMTVAHVRHLIPLFKSLIGDRPLEVSTHCINAVGPLLALEAAVHGADRLGCSVGPVSDGNAPPSAQMLARCLREIGFDVDIDDRALDSVGEYLAGVADEQGFPLGVPAEFDPSHFETQYAGGAMTNLQAQLTQAGLADKLPAVIDEIARIRVELGSPVMSTPFPAMVAAQAVMNVLNGERYKVVPDEVKKYVCGHFGALPIPVDENIKDLVINNGARDIPLGPPELRPVMPGLRQRYPGLSDDELLLRYMYGDQKINALQPTIVDDTFSVRKPLQQLIAGLATLPSRRTVQISLGGLEIRANG